MGKGEGEAEPQTAAELERIARLSYDAWNADDWDALESFAWPDAVIVPPDGWPEPGEQVGWPKIRAQFERLKEPLRDEGFEILAIEADPPCVLTAGVWGGFGEGSGLEMRVPMWIVTTYRGRRWVRIEYFLEEDKARASWKAARGSA